LPPALPPPPPPSPSPGAQRRIRWGIGDAVWAFVVGLVVSLVAAAFVVNPDDPNSPTTLLVLLAAQNLSIIAWLAMVARRKGAGSLRADFGLTLRPARGTWFDDVPWFFAGIGVQIAALLPIGLLNALYGHSAEQEVVRSADRALGWQVPLIILAVVVLAPVTEELLFRGALLRSLLRRTTPDRAVFASAAVFGIVHVIGDPSVGSLIALPAIILLGIVSGYQAARTGNLSRSIMLHMGFNALSAVLLFTT
jgi:membrane protease YdiL (CAAX protease family)